MSIPILLSYITVFFSTHEMIFPLKLWMDRNLLYDLLGNDLYDLLGNDHPFAS